ncbi:MAG: polyamine aminopropyltransferase [Thermofilaceae archaeon]|nr:polyamine aminopropyltransferase [Thermofilaceae archaeon]MCX8181124.1 polyamine aminopropyltransferase [Thermofilaceae archaeon]MDW8004870.1 polyamine aminopropyltransferase [Thermofilaceae archaeon]
MTQQVWRFVVEWMVQPFEAHMHGVKRVLYSGETKFQKVDIVETFSFGKCLFLDGKLQSSEYDERVYHEALVHPAMVTHPEPRRVLIIGGGEGATAREVLRYSTVEQVVMVDIDRELVELCKRYMPEWNRGAFEDPRLKLVFEDGRKYVEDGYEKFDVIIIDLTDPIPGTPSVLLYTKEFYELVRRRLSGDGVVVTQATSLRYTLDTFAMIRNALASVFPIARPYVAPITSFISLWGFVLASVSRDPLFVRAEEIKARLTSMNEALAFYDEEVHRYLFHLPRFIRGRIELMKDIPTDSNPAFSQP